MARTSAMSAPSGNAPPRFRLEQIPYEREVFGQMIIFDREVAASRAAESGDAAPIVVERDILRRQRREHDDWAAAIFRFGAFHDRTANDPLGMADAAVEAPAAVEPEAAGLAHGAPGREEGDRRGRDLPAGENQVETGLRQKSAERSDTSRADHGAPGAGKVVISEPFEHHHFGDRISFGAADGGRQLQAEHAGFAQGGDRFRRQRPELFALWPGCLQDRADALDLVEEKFPLRLALLGKLLDHDVSPDAPWPCQKRRCVVIIAQWWTILIYERQSIIDG